MMKDFGGPLKGGMPIYKYVGNRVLTAVENRARGLNLTEVHSGYRAYSLNALRQIRLDNITDDFHFDTEIIIKLHHQNFRIKEVPIPTFYGDEVCRVDGVRYAKDVVKAVYRYTCTARAVRCFPEYEEYFVPYAIKRGRYSSHFYALRLTGKDQRVLEANCGDGSLGSQLAAANNRVTGLDASPKVSLSAGYQNVVAADLENGVPDLPAKSFDRILLLDTIEHLRDARPLLDDCRGLLAQRGRLIVAVPNTVNLTVRFMVLFGMFCYSDRGILDWSHLRFFTRASAERLLRERGFRITGRHYTIMPLERIVPLPAESRLLRICNGALRLATRIAPGLLAYEVVIVAEASR
jgi:2-polyprenyl-3-methyl-5-hydroxy-6-metoxy-1,4-benzoquinol methylase